MDTELFKLIPNRKLHEELRHKLKQDCVLRTDFLKVNEDRHNLQEKVDSLTNEVARLNEELASSDRRLNVALTENKRLKQMINELELAKEAITEELDEYKESVENLNRQVARLKEEKKSMELDFAKKMEEFTQQTDNHGNVVNKDKHLRRIQSDFCFPGRAVQYNTSNMEQIQNWVRGTGEITSAKESRQEVQQQGMAVSRRRLSTSATRINAGLSGYGTNDSDTFSENSQDRILSIVNTIRGLVKELQKELTVRTDSLSGGSQCGQELIKMKQEVGYLRWIGDQNIIDDSLGEKTVGSSNTDRVRSQESSPNSQSSKSDLDIEVTSLSSSTQNLDKPFSKELTQSKKVKHRRTGHTRTMLHRRKKPLNAKEGSLSARGIELSHVEDLQDSSTRKLSPKGKSAWSDVNQSYSPRSRTNTRQVAHYSKAYIQSVGVNMLSGNTSLSQSMTLPNLDSNIPKKGTNGAHIGPSVALIKQPQSCLRPQQQCINRS